MKIEIVSYETGEVIKEFDVSGKSERSINKIDDGINVNLNHDEYFTRVMAKEDL